MHRLIGVIGDHTLQDRNRTKCVCISQSIIMKTLETKSLLPSLLKRE
jgi:hypothetical protein